jgi:drug/metabolite transporter (DMT)-like permease
MIGFAGVLIVAHPGSSAIPLQGALIALSSAALIAVISILLRQLGRTEAPATTAFWFCFLSTGLTAIPMVWAARVHSGPEWALLLALGFTGAVAQVALTASVRLAPITTVISMDYTSLFWATLFGYVLFDTLPASSTWAGVPLIAGSGLYIAWREHRLGAARAPR